MRINRVYNFFLNSMVEGNHVHIQPTIAIVYEGTDFNVKWEPRMNRRGGGWSRRKRYEEFFTFLANGSVFQGSRPTESALHKSMDKTVFMNGSVMALKFGDLVINFRDYGEMCGGSGARDMCVQRTDRRVGRVGQSTLRGQGNVYEDVLSNRQPFCDFWSQNVSARERVGLRHGGY